MSEKQKTLAECLADNDTNPVVVGKNSDIDINRFRLRGTPFTDEISNLYLPEIDDAWAWCDGRGECGVHSNYKIRGRLFKIGKNVSLDLQKNLPKKTLDIDSRDLDLLKKIDCDFISEVFVTEIEGTTKIFLVDLMYFGSDITGYSFKERRKYLKVFYDNYLSSGVTFDILEVRWIQTRQELSEAISWCLDDVKVKSAFIKSESGEYPTKGPSSDWYQLRKDNKLLEKQTEQQPENVDDVTLLAMASMGYRVEPKTEILKKENTKQVQIMKMDNEKRFILGVVLEPMEIDAQEDIMIPQDIEDAAHDYLANRRVVGIRHEDEAEDYQVVESYIAPVDFELNGESVKKGSWLLGLILGEDDWAKVKSGEYNGYSVGGFGEREELE